VQELDGERPGRLRPILSDRGQNIVAGAHRGPPRFAWYQV
jgi:hypothetical protein